MPQKALRIATEYIQDLISRENMKPGTRMPSMHELAKAAGVSLVTIWNVVGRLSAEGILETSQRKGTYVSKAGVKYAPLQTESAHNPQVWQRIARRIEQDTLAGALGRGDQLPSVKQLAARYGVNHRTMRKALHALSDAGALKPYGRGYRLSSQDPKVTGNTVLVFLYCDREQIWLQYLDPNLLRFIEDRCRRSGCIPIFILYRRTEGVVTFTDHTTGEAWTPRAVSPVFGCLWVVLWDHEVIDECCRTLISAHGPVAVLDNTGSAPYPDYFRDHHDVKFFKCESDVRSGEVIARRLLRLGHRRIAYISVNFERAWSRDRFNGLLRVYRTAGQGCSAGRFTTDIPGIASGLTPEYDYTRPTLDFMRLRAPQPRGISRDRLAEHLARTVHTGLWHSYYLWGVVSNLEPLFKKALRDRTITAWVCGDDEEALAALFFLKRNRVPVPRRISVVGYNNSLEALKNNLTSFTANYEAILDGMIDHIIRPDVAVGLRKNKVLVIEGCLVERKTTGPAR